METSLPTPEQSNASATRDSRWRWMENRWLALFLTVLVSAISIANAESHGIVGSLRTYYMDFVRTCCTRLGVSIPAFMAALPRQCALLWFLPIALQLGWWRVAVWLGLTVLGIALSYVARGQWLFAPLLFPCLAMIGRRTRPWLVLPASLAFALVAIVNLPLGVQPRHLYLVVCLLPYAAILIFGTKLIPKRPATAGRPFERVQTP